MIRAERNLGFFICENFFVEARKLLGLNKKLLLSRRIKYNQNKKAPNVFLKHRRAYELINKQLI